MKFTVDEYIAVSAPLERPRIIGKLEFIEGMLRRTLERWDDAPRSAQLAAVNMAWVLGGGFARYWPKFATAWAGQRWDRCAEECRIAGDTARNNLNVALFGEASAASRGEANPKCH